MYARYGGAARRRFLAIAKKISGGGGVQTPPPNWAWAKHTLTRIDEVLLLNSRCFTVKFDP